VLREIYLTIENLQIDSLLVSPVEWSYLHTVMGKFESLRKGESRVQSADLSRAYRKPRAFNCCSWFSL